MTVLNGAHISNSLPYHAAAAGAAEKGADDIGDAGKDVLTDIGDAAEDVKDDLMGETTETHTTISDSSESTKSTETTTK